jgi:hypothetical protein
MANRHSDMAAVDAERAAVWDACRNYAEAARQLGCSRAAVQDSVRRVHGGPVPTPGFAINRLTTARNADDEVTGTYTQERPDKGDTRADPLPGFAIARRTVHRIGGEVAQVWEQEKPDAQRQLDGLRAFVQGLAEPIEGMAPLVTAPKHTDDDLLVIYPMGDPHFGLYSWGEETGENFDLAENERVHCAAIDRLVALAPNARHATLLNLGDFFHADSGKNETTKGTPVDVDGRYQKVMWTGAKAMRRCILRMLEKHETVRVRNIKGNHDGNAHMGLAMALAAFFENNPRVTVDMSPATHTFQRFGKVLIGECHGDTTKPADLPGVMMCDAREHISETTFWHWHCGHVHHDSLKEYQNVVVETHRTLAGKDAWHTSQGYRSGRTMKAITYHREFGEVHRSTCDVAMLRAA